MTLNAVAEDCLGEGGELGLWGLQLWTSWLQVHTAPAESWG